MHKFPFIHLLISQERDILHINSQLFDESDDTHLLKSTNGNCHQLAADFENVNAPLIAPALIFHTHQRVKFIYHLKVIAFSKIRHFLEAQN